MDNNTTLREADLPQEPGDAFSLLFEIFIGKFLHHNYQFANKNTTLSS